MPVQIFTDAERERLNRFPDAVEHSDLITFFTLSDTDIARIPVHSGIHNRLGFAMQLCTLRFMGFIPSNLTSAPFPIVEYVASQIRIEPGKLAEYGIREHTRTDHLQKIMAYLGYRKANDEYLDKLSNWLLERALEHDKPSLLYELACEKLRSERILRPGITFLERLIAEARQRAQAETMRRLGPILTGKCRSSLDSLLVPDFSMTDAARARTSLSWLRQSATSNSPNAILENIDKLAFLEKAGVFRWRLDELNPNHLKRLAQVARKSDAQALRRSPAERRYPTLIAFLYRSLVDITDETIDMFDRCLAVAYTRAGRELDMFRRSVAGSTNEKLRLFRELGQAILNPDIDDANLRAVIYQHISPVALQTAVEECDQIIRPSDDSYFDFLKSRYNYFRQFIPTFLNTFTFHSNMESASLLEAIDLLRRLNTERRRIIPEDTPLDFVPQKWYSYVIDYQGQISRHYYELCVLWELRNALRAGNIWLESSRRYANPETYLIPKNRWASLRLEVCQQLQIPEDGSARLTERETELKELLSRVDTLLSQDSKVRIDKDNLVVSPLEAEERPESVVELEQHIDQRLPHVELSSLLIEVDSWTQFTQHFEHVNTGLSTRRESRSRDFLQHLYGSILAYGCNLGFAKMAQIADLSKDRLDWCSHWYLREETLKTAVTSLVNFLYHQPLSQYWGSGALSSSDGQRFPVSGRIRNAAALPRYFGYGRGVTFYTWTSDQFSQYGTKVIPATVRDATYVLDEILDNETELSILEHTTDTSGYTELIFALFDLLGMQFSPRIRDISDQRLYRLEPRKIYQNLKPLLKGKINRDQILRHQDDLLRIAGSLKIGWVTASLLISKLQSYPRQNALTRALQEYGKLIKTIFILRYIESEEFRRRINAQLNKGEALHALRRFLFFAHEGKIRRKQLEAQSHQALCLNLITNAVITWNTVYMSAVIEQLKTEGHSIQESDLGRISPARFEHINPYGKYYFEVEKELVRKELRPLRHL